MNQPRWQLARVLSCENYPALVGTTLWVTRGGLTNMTHEGRRCAYVPEYIELLPEFADDVALIDWQDFLEGVEA